MTYICQTKCFHGGRLWTPGEELDVQAGDLVPSHFQKAPSTKGELSDVMAESVPTDLPSESTSSPVDDFMNTPIVEEVPEAPKKKKKK